MTTQIRTSATAEKIVLSAAQLFAGQGYHGTSTREIARLAGVSENTLFRHFDHKEDLFWSALLSHTKGVKMRRDLQEGLSQCEAPEVVVPKILELLSDTVAYRPQLLRLIAVAFLEMQWKAEVFSQEHFSPVVTAISTYLRTNIKSGNIRDLDAGILTSAIIMTVLTHSGVSNLIEDNRPAYANNLEAQRAHSRFWLELIVPRNQVHSWPAH